VAQAVAQVLTGEFLQMAETAVTLFTVFQAQ
jgi:hypothetical protein